MKYLIFFLLTVIVYGQPSKKTNELGFTILPLEEYNTTKFEGVLFTDIKATNGNIEQLNELLLNTKWNWNGKSKKPNAVTIEMYGYEIGEPQRVFNYNSGLMIAFGLQENGTNYLIGRLESNNITINGETLEVDMPISKLTSVNYIINEGPYNNKFVSIIQPNGYSTPISIDLDHNNIITEIVYFEVP